MADKADTDTAGSLEQDLLDALNLFLNEKAGAEGLVCPITAEPTPITEWNAPDGIIVVPGQGQGAGYDALPLTSPAGGVLLVSVMKLREWQDAKKSNETENKTTEEG